MRDPWARLAGRAERLAGGMPEAGRLLEFYGRVLDAQGRIADALASLRLDPESASTDEFRAAAAAARPLLDAVASHGTEALKRQVEPFQAGPDALAGALAGFWADSTDTAFLPKALCQAWARTRLDAGARLPGRPYVASGATLCPACGGPPQVGVLRAGQEGEAGSRALVCAHCLTVFTVPRVRCPACGEEDEHRLGYFRAEALSHVRADLCDTCRRYLKTVDLTRLGLAEPLVDEVGAAALDVWAADRGYSKIELNLVGL